MTIKVLLADDHEIVRSGLKSLLESHPWITVAGEAGNGREVLELAEGQCPDLVVMDIAMPDLNGIEATKQLVKKCPGTRVVILSVYSTSEHIYRAFQAGASGYVLKESTGRELVEAIRAAHCCRLYLSSKILDANPDMLKDIERSHSPLDRLSGREREILQLVVEGKTSAAIAKTLSLSPKTVETYRSRLMQKLGVKDLPSLVKYAVQHGIIPL